MNSFNTRIDFNGNVLFIALPKDKLLDNILFNTFLKRSTTFVINDDGQELGMKEELSHFDISTDKDRGHKWEYEVSEDSLSIIKKFLNKISSKGHVKWSLLGKGFHISYHECGDMADLMNGPDGPQTISNHFIIESEAPLTKEIEHIFQEFPLKKQ